MSELEKSIVEMAAKKMGYSEKRIALSTTLQHDLGMDGDDAAEFFDEFSNEFPGDYSGLQVHWHRHFMPECGPSGIPIWLIPISGLSAVPAIAIHAWQPWIPAWLLIVVFVLAALVLSMKIYVMLHPNTDPPMRPITIQNLVDAATTRQWPLEYGDWESKLPSYWPSVVPPQD
jgi:hypothetical protein